MSKIRDRIGEVKKASRQLAQISDEVRQKVLYSLADKLLENIDTIVVENEKDLSQIKPDDYRYDRLKLTKERLESLSKDVRRVAELASPLNRVLLQRTMPNGLLLKKISVPLGVIGVIYESRPNVTIDVFSLCFKSGNACVLKGGKEAQNSNEVLVKIIQEAIRMHGITEDVIYLMPSEREIVYELLHASGLVDVCIPRGSQALIQFVRENAKVPIIETGAGIVHLYFDESGNVDKGRAIIDNSKTRRVSVCNALDTLIIHEKRLVDLVKLVEHLANKNVEIYADKSSYDVLLGHYPRALLNEATDEDFGKEFLSYKMSIKTVKSCEEAIEHIMQYSSWHSEGIIAEDKEIIDYYLNNVDAAAVYVNASTAFTDGGEFGMGAEIGISTQKLHARGPMGLEELTSYKWVIHGDGQVRRII